MAKEITLPQNFLEPLKPGEVRKFSVSREDAHHRAMLSFTESQFGRIETRTDYTKPKRKSDLKPEVKRLYRKERYTQDEISAMTGLSQSTVSRWLNE